jgi:hypothetical protein
VPERRALFGGPVDAALYRVDIEERQRVGAGPQRRLLREFGQHPTVHRLYEGRFWHHERF